MNSFEKKVFDSLKKLLGREALGRTKVLGVAVSGGADSVSLLSALAEIAGKPKSRAAFPKIAVVTVDHSIRPESESAGDAAFVQKLCESLGIECHLKKIERGAVARVALERSKGLEDAARFLRYQKFEEFAAESGAEFICLAHNQNDFLETILMRFLQGSSSGAAGGIAAKRGVYLRPLLDVSRAEIEAYLREKKIEWRTDATNGDNSYLRNKIRNSLVPFLDENFCGWKKALLAGAEKAALEDQALDAALDEKIAGSSPAMTESESAQVDNFLAIMPRSGRMTENEGMTARGRMTARESGAACGQVEFSRSLFEGLSAALRQRLLYRALDSFGLDARVPYSFVREICAWPEKDFKNIAAAGLEAHSKKEKVFIKKSQKEATESGFFDIISDDELCGGPCVLRSAAAGDKAGNDF